MLYFFRQQKTARRINLLAVYFPKFSNHKCVFSLSLSFFQHIRKSDIPVLFLKSFHNTAVIFKIYTSQFYKIKTILFIQLFNNCSCNAVLFLFQKLFCRFMLSFQICFIRNNAFIPGACRIVKCRFKPFCVVYIFGIS